MSYLSHIYLHWYIVWHESKQINNIYLVLVNSFVVGVNAYNTHRSMHTEIQSERPHYYIHMYLRLKI